MAADVCDIATATFCSVSWAYQEQGAPQTSAEARFGQAETSGQMTRSNLPLDRFPAEFHADIRRAVDILKEGGCTEVHVIGSVAEGGVREGSDLDLAVRGCPPERFFTLLGRLLAELEHSVDLVDLDRDHRIAAFLSEHQLAVHVG